MSEDSPADHHDAVDSETFEAWVQQAADSKGVSKQELLNQMLSSYWILDELTGLVGETERNGGEGGSIDPNEADSGSERPVERDTGSTDAVPGPDPGSDSRPESPPSEQSMAESVEAIQEAIRELVETQSAADAEQAAAEGDVRFDPPSDDGLVSFVSELQRQIGRFDSELEELEGRQDEQFERLSNELQLILDRLDTLETERSEFARRGDLDALRNEVRDFDERLESLRGAHSELDARIDREFDSIESLFRRVLDAIDDLDSELDAATDSYRDELEPIKEREADQKRLRTLKTEALRREVRQGACQSCDQRIDLTLLEAPDCPHCNSRLTGIDGGGWNPFRSPTIETGPIDDA